MFWRFGNYANVSTLDSILDKPDVTLEDLLDESDLIQELKQHNSKLIEYLRDEKILRRLLEYVIAPEAPKAEDAGEDDSEDEQPIKEKSLSPFRRSKENRGKTRRQEQREEWDKADKARQKNAFIASEILSSETWSIIESLMEHQHHLRTFWDFLNREPPLEATVAGYFTKVNETLLDKKTEETIQFVKTQPNVVAAILKHVDCPMIMDLLLKIISMEKSEGGMGIVDWLQDQGLIPLLLRYLSKEYPSATQTSAGDFIKAIITISANASGDTQSCIGPNNLTRQLVSDESIQSLVSDMLRGGNPLTVGVGTIIEVIRKNNSDYDMDNGAPDAVPSSNDPIYLGSLLRTFAKHIPDFMALILSPTHTVPDGESTMTRTREDLSVAFGSKIEPLGFDRFKTCELMAELLHCSNMGLLNESGSEAYVRQRDEERDRRKAEGSLTSSIPPTAEVPDLLDNAGDINNQLSEALNGSPQGTRELGVTNNAEDDEFEDVSTPAELEDDIKEEFDEKDTFELESKPAQTQIFAKQTRPRLDLDEEFVDEPLTSPIMEAIDLTEATSPIGASTAASQEPDATSPIRELSSEFAGLNVESNPPTAEDDDTVTLPSFHDGEAAAPAPLNVHPSNGAPPLPARAPLNQPKAPDENSQPELSSHPDDKPAPLFAKRPESDRHEDGAEQVGEAMMGEGNSQGTIDTTGGEEGDSARSMTMSTNDQTFEPQIESDDNGEPLVGDLLKMMFVEHKVVPTILDFFFRFPWNNFLHNVVYDVVQQVFNGPMDKGYNRSLAIDLFQGGRITERIVEGQRRSDEAQAKNNMRLGYMGHLTLIAEEVVKFSDRHPNETLSQAVLDKVTSKQWSDYVENTLSETRERDNAILGGIPPNISVGPRQAVLNAVNAAGFAGGASNALANAGLNGSAGLDSMDLATNGGSSSSAFGLSSGSLLSGFGSSSDEEDEEMEEVEADEAGIAGSDQLSATSSHTPSSLSALSAFNTSTATPPSDPPPAPPPLNLPPSRARRQFAARLALHSQQAQQIQQQAQADAVAAAGKNTPVQEHAQDLGSPPEIEITQHDDGSDSSDDGAVMMMTHTKPSSVDEKGAATYPSAGAPGGSAGNISSDEDAESEEMRFGGEGLEGFVHSPRDMQAEGSDGSDEGLEMGLGRMEGHEEDIGKGRRS
ncbi:MAG: hypothetical protein LQ339_002667 [Xanthoria mediterranea]|nr:MAG: hypothetical protein LQ339_002667 [Xanthoria mediterranea]